MSLNDLERLHRLHNAGALSDDEFAQQKAILLATISLAVNDRSDGVGTTSRRKSYVFPLVIVGVIVAAIAVKAILMYIQPAPKAAQEGGVTLNEQVAAAPLKTPSSYLVSKPENDWHEVSDTRSVGIEPEIPDEDFYAYRTPLLSGTFRLPPRSHAYFSALEDAEKKGVVFAGHYAVAIVGCGTYCTFSFAIDGRTGKVIDFPFSGEQYGDSFVRYSPLSRLVKGYWNADDQGICDYAAYVLSNGAFRKIKNEVNRDQCPKELLPVRNPLGQ